MNIAPITRSVPTPAPLSAAPKAEPALHPAAVDHFECAAEQSGDSGIQPEWGFRGHGMVHEVAAETLPQEMPSFFKQAKDRLVGLASQPDRWKTKGLDYLKEATAMDHYMAYEQIREHQLPPDRYEYVSMVEREHINAPGQAPKWVGTLPYRVAELYQNLTLDFAIWRKEGQDLAPDDPKRKALEENVLVSAGLLGHYVGDASQPLHSTVHHDGWNRFVPNPNGYRTRRGLHREFEAGLVNAVADENQVKSRVAAPHHLDGDPLNWGLGFIAESNSHVEELYQLEKQGALDPRHPSDAGVNFLHDRMAVGAQNLRDLWYTAWEDSKSLARRLDTPQ